MKMTPSERAREIVTKWLCAERNGDASEHPGDHELINDVAMALTIPPGHLRDEHGVDRKALGTPLFTADNCFAFPGAEVWTPDGSDYNVGRYPTPPWRPIMIFKDGAWQVHSYVPVAVEMCYSSKEVAREAAEAARGGGK